MRIPGGGSSALARARALELARQRAEAARRRAEEARRRAEEARRRAAEAAQAAREAQAAARSARSEANAAKSQLSAKETRFERDAGRLSPAERQQLSTDIRELRTRVGELEQRASAAEARADQLRRQSLTAADEALEAQKAANEASIRAGESKPFELVDRVHDVFDAGSLSAADQSRLFGTQSLVTPEEAARADAVRVGAANSASVRNGSQVLLEQLQASSDPAYRAALIRESLPHIEEMGRQVSLDDGRPSEADLQATLANLSRLAELAGPTARQIADAFATHIPDHDLDIDDKDRLGGALKEIIKQGNGATFAAELAGSLDRLGRSEAAAEVVKLTREALSDLREDFEEAHEEVSQLNAELGSYLAGFGPMMTDEQRQAAIEAFRARHEEAYASWEEAGRKLASALEGAGVAMANPVVGGDQSATWRGVPIPGEGERLREEAQKALELLPQVGQTQAGLEVVAEAVARQGRGEPAFLDHVQAVGSVVEDGKTYTDAVATLVVKGTALKALELASSGRRAEVPNLLRGLDRNAALLGVDQTQLEDLTRTLERFGPNLSDARLRQLAAEVDQKLGAMELEPGSRVGQALRGLGVAFGALDVVTGIANFSEADLSQRISTLGNALSVGADGGTMLLDVFGKSSRFLRAAGPVGAVVGAIGDGLGAVEAFRNGEYAEGAASSAMAVGAVLMAVPSGVSQVIGGALIVGGAVAKFFMGRGEEHADEDDLKAFLEAGGVNPRVADAINDLNGDRQNYGEMLRVTASELGVTPGELVRHMATWNDDQLDQLQGLLGFTDRDEPQEGGRLLAAAIREANLAP